MTEKVLSAEEVDRLTSIAKGQGDEQMKGAAITNWVNGVVFTNQASLNYDELERQQQQSQQQQLSTKFLSTKYKVILAQHKGKVNFLTYLSSCFLSGINY